MSKKKISAIWRVVIASLLGAIVLQISRASRWFGFKGGASAKEWFVTWIILFCCIGITNYVVKYANTKAAASTSTIR